MIVAPDYGLLPERVRRRHDGRGGRLLDLVFLYTASRVAESPVAEGAVETWTASSVWDTVPEE